MLEWLNNPWVVGIGGGVLSGIIVTIISRALLSKRENREYLQKLISTNHEIIYAIRPGLSEGVVPSAEVVQALIGATARKYGVDAKDVYGPAEIAQELVKEVMDSSFISAKAKEEYCSKLSELTIHRAEVLAQVEVTREVPERPTVRAASLADYRARMVTLMSIMMGILTATMTVLLAFVQFKERLLPFELELPPEKVWLLLPAALSLLAVLLTTLFSVLNRDLRARRDDRERKTESAPTETVTSEDAPTRET